MMLVRIALFLGLTLLLGGCEKPVAPPPIRAQATPLSCSPAELQKQVAEIARATGGPVGAAAIIVESPAGPIAYNGDQRFPMQSVYKLPIGMAVLHQVDLGTLKLDQTIKVDPKDYLTGRQHSPIRDRNPRGIELTLRELLRYAVSESDGTASDVLMKTLGGAAPVEEYLKQIGVEGITVLNTEKELGEDEQVQYRNWATPLSMLRLLQLLQEGKGLSPSSRGLLLEFMTKSPTGPKRLKGLLPEGTVVAHKTGSSGEVGGIARATNDVGLITLPDGRHLAVAVFVSDTKVNEATREEVIAKIARAAWDCHVK